MDTQIRVYSPDGRLLRRIGGQGKGPGEFDGLPRFGVHGDTIWATSSSRRTSNSEARFFTSFGSVRTQAVIARYSDSRLDGASACTASIALNGVSKSALFV